MTDFFLFNVIGTRPSMYHANLFPYYYYLPFILMIDPAQDRDQYIE